MRKNSTANAGGGSSSTMRPRANTISHMDNNTLGLIAAANSSVTERKIAASGYNQRPRFNGLPGPGGYEFRGMSTATGHHGNLQGLPKLETNGLNIDVSGGLHTAPAYGNLRTDMDMNNMLYGPSTTINPAQLHFNDSPQPFAYDASAPSYQHVYGMPSLQPILDDGNFAWLNGFEHQMSFNHNNEQVIDNSSPSVMSTGSPPDINEVMLDGSNIQAQEASWQPSMMSPGAINPMYSMDFTTSTIPEIFPPATLSPKSSRGQLGNIDQYFSSPPPFSAQSPVPIMSNSHCFHPPMALFSDTPSTSAASVSSSARQSSVTSTSTDSITDACRHALLTCLSQPSIFGHGHLRNSQPVVSSPLSPAFGVRPRSVSGVSLPSTYDLQRYVAAYIQYFHPHLPFLHVSSLSFDSPIYTSNLRTPIGQSSFNQSGIAGGGGCLLLAMAAIGALYESDIAASKDLFDMAKKMIQIYLEERRKADMSAAMNGTQNLGENSTQDTPLWLVQSMLLNVIYGHNSGDKTAADIASTHCAALVSLARAAEFAKPPLHVANTINARPQPQHRGPSDEDFPMGGNITSAGNWGSSGNHNAPDDQVEWYAWKYVEERKRTLFAVFILSSLLVSAYNHTPALMNSEITLDLPCSEELWAADSADSWYALGGSHSAEQNAIPFASALSSLLTASQRQRPQQYPNQTAMHRPFGLLSNIDSLPESEFSPSTFGCLVLINALHNYIWETRQRHLGRQWTSEETEAMHAHIEPALRAWHAAWASNPQHSLERPNPHGLGPLSADSIPLLDLAYVRLFVNLGRSKEAFWQRDYDGMADELARGTEIVQHADYSVDSSSAGDGSVTNTISSSSSSPSAHDASYDEFRNFTANFGQADAQQIGQCSKRERHLRKAAFYAADSLSMADKLGVTFADFNSRELPLQSALCAFDCAQVLAEWVSSLQERAGPYVGILGRDRIEFGQIQAMTFLEDEDCKLLEKITEVLSSAEVKMAMDNSPMNERANLSPTSGLPNLADCCFGSKILRVTAYMLEKAAVWPGMFCQSFASMVIYLMLLSHAANGSVTRNPSYTY